MPDSKLIQTPNQIHKQTAANIADNLATALGEKHEVIPTTSDSDPGVDGNILDQTGELKDRLVLGKVAVEPSKSWLKKLFKREKEKQPDSDIGLKQAA